MDRRLQLEASSDLGFAVAPVLRSSGGGLLRRGRPGPDRGTRRRRARPNPGAGDRKPRDVTADAKLSGTAEMVLTHPISGASFTKSSWRCSHFAEGGTSESDLREERGGPFHPGPWRPTISHQRQPPTPGRMTMGQRGISPRIASPKSLLPNRYYQIVTTKSLLPNRYYQIVTTKSLLYVSDCLN